MPNILRSNKKFYSNIISKIKTHCICLHFALGTFLSLFVINSQGELYRTGNCYYIGKLKYAKDDQFFFLKSSRLDWTFNQIISLYRRLLPLRYVLKNTFFKYHCVESIYIRSFFWFIFSCIWTEYEDLLSKSLNYLYWSLFTCIEMIQRLFWSRGGMKLIN